MRPEICLVKDSEETKELEEIINVVRDSADCLQKCQIDVLEEQSGMITGLAEGAQAVLGAGLSAERIATVVTRSAFTAGNLAKVVRVAGIALNVAFVVVDVVGIVWHSVSLAQGRKCDAAEALNRKIKELEDHRDSVVEMYTTLENLFNVDLYDEIHKDITTEKKELYY